MLSQILAFVKKQTGRNKLALKIIAEVNNKK